MKIGEKLLEEENNLHKSSQEEGNVVTIIP